MNNDNFSKIFRDAIDRAKVGASNRQAENVDKLFESFKASVSQKTESKPKTRGITALDVAKSLHEKLVKDNRGVSTPKIHNLLWMVYIEVLKTQNKKLFVAVWQSCPDGLCEQTLDQELTANPQGTLSQMASIKFPSFVDIAIDDVYRKYGALSAYYLANVIKELDLYKDSRSGLAEIDPQKKTIDRVVIDSFAKQENK